MEQKYNDLEEDDEKRKDNKKEKLFHQLLDRNGDQVDDQDVEKKILDVKLYNKKRNGSKKPVRVSGGKKRKYNNSFPEDVDSDMLETDDDEDEDEETDSTETSTNSSDEEGMEEMIGEGRRRKKTKARKKPRKVKRGRKKKKKLKKKMLWRTRRNCQKI